MLQRLPITDTYVKDGLYEVHHIGCIKSKFVGQAMRICFEAGHLDVKMLKTVATRSIPVAQNARTDTEPWAFYIRTQTNCNSTEEKAEAV